MRTKEATRRFMPPRTWAELKDALQALGVKDSDKVYGVDLGPSRCKLLVDRDKLGVEITDDAEPIMET